MNSTRRDEHIIKDHLYEKATEIYNQYNGGNINQLAGYDPLIDLLIGACASEFKKVYDEMDSSWSRVLEHTSSLLLPETYQGALPAHGIVHATAESHDINTSSEEDIVTYSLNNKDLFFSPLDEYPLLQGDVLWMASGKSLFFIEKFLEKKEINRTASTAGLPSSHIWIGIEWTQVPEEVKSLRLFFDWGNQELHRQSEALLSNTKWFCQGEALAVQLGLESATIASDQMPFEEGYSVRKIEKETASFYKNQFVTLKKEGTDFFTKDADFPAELKDLFGEDTLQRSIKGTVTWIKMELTPTFLQGGVDGLRKLNVQINCFPVLNRRIKAVNYSIDTDFNLFPLPLPDHAYFFQIEEILNAHHKSHRYKEQPLQLLITKKELSTNRIKNHIYAIRHASVQRFDERTAIEIIEELLYKVREESFVFDSLGRDVVSSNVTVIKKALNDMERKLGEAKAIRQTSAQSIPFIAFPGSKEREYIIIRYWMNQGTAANYVQAGTNLQTTGTSFWKKQTIRLMNTTNGGRNPLSKNERLEALKSSLLTKDQILTEEDIRHYCYKVLVDQIQTVNIKKGFAINGSAKRGFSRTLDVLIEFLGHQEEHYKLFIEQKLTTELNDKSAILIPIRVRVSSTKKI